MSSFPFQPRYALTRRAIKKTAEAVTKMSAPQKVAHLQEVWLTEQNEWRTFFGYDFRYFLQEVDLAIYREILPDLHTKKDVRKPVIHEPREYEQLTMDQIREVDVDYWRTLRESVFSRYQDEDGFYVCQKSGFRSKQKVFFHIDHIVPFSSGGLTRIENLQLLHFRETLRKGSRPE